MNHTTKECSSHKRNLKWGITALMVIGAGFLMVQHWVHVPQYLPYLLLALCPLMHIFMHRGHGGHGEDQPPKVDVKSD